MSNIHVLGMHGCGDNIHERALIRHLIGRGHNVWLETPWPCVFHDLVGDQLHLVNKQSSLRTQAKNARREADKYGKVPIPAGAQRLRVAYAPQSVRHERSVLGAMLHQCNAGGADPDFRLPIPAEWSARADRWLQHWNPSRPLLIYRPLIERTEWGGCRARNPEPRVYRDLVEAIRAQFFVVSVADLVPGQEWQVGFPIRADVEMHRGELEFETLAALTARAGLVFTSPGFAVILAQAVGTPSVCVFGGYEAGYSFSLGARYARHLAIEPINPCPCFQHHHACNKTTDLPAALAALQAFLAPQALAA